MVTSTWLLSSQAIQGHLQCSLQQDSLLLGAQVKHGGQLDQACLHASLMHRGLQVFKRALDEVYRLKIQAARKVFGQINRIAPTMPFTVRPPHPV